jgi:hypothetical protein
VSVAENTTAVTTIRATDADGTTPTYAIAGGADAAKFAINTTSGALTFKATPDFEAPSDAGANNVYDVIVRANDGVHTDDQALAITVTNVANESAPVITRMGWCDGIGERCREHDGCDNDPCDGRRRNNPTYAIAGGADAAKFAINTTSGALTFKATPDFEAPSDAGANNVYDVIVRANDGVHTDDQALAITVTNVANESAPVITSKKGGATASVSVAENTTAVTTIRATDADGTTPTYAIAGGAVRRSSPSTLQAVRLPLRPRRTSRLRAMRALTTSTT